MRTLILACSATKRSDAGLLPALARYDGPAYRTLRANACATWAELRVLILSAEFGLIAHDKPIADYDRRMTTPRALELAPTAGTLEGDILVVAGETYRQCIAAAIAGTPLAGRLRFSAGGIGVQLGQLKAFVTGARA